MSVNLETVLINKFVLCVASVYRIEFVVLDKFIQNFIFNTGRAVGGFAPLVISLLAAQYTLNGALALLAVIYIAAAVNVFFLVPETKGKPIV